MSTAKHTPGPWAVNPIMRDQICTFDGLKALAIANRDGDPYEVMATAQLIAAAPELLKELKDVLSRIENSHEWWMDCPTRGGFDVVAIRDAIAKAEGNA